MLHKNCNIKKFLHLVQKLYIKILRIFPRIMDLESILFYSYLTATTKNLMVIIDKMHILTTTYGIK